MDYVDIHTHILPGVDDGADTLEETARMLRLAHRGGTRRLIATPHVHHPMFDNHDPEPLRQAFAHMVETLEQWSERPHLGFLRQMQLYLGTENFLSPEFLEALEARSVLTLNGGFYLLLEFAPYFAAATLRTAIERILGTGFVPVLAHVERYPPFVEHPGRLAELLELGCIAQLNGSSLMRGGRGGARSAALSLLDQGLIHVIASDGHGSEVRRPDLDRVSAFLRKKFSAEQVAAWMFENPARILDNQSLA